MSHELTAGLAAYAAASNEPAPEARASRLASCMTDDVVVSAAPSMSRG
jgi:hypothetical protein